MTAEHNLLDISRQKFQIHGQRKDDFVSRPNVTATESDAIQIGSGKSSAISRSINCTKNPNARPFLANHRASDLCSRYFEL